MTAPQNQNKGLPSVTLISLGCPKNLVDSEIILGLFAGEGYQITPRMEEADIVVVNTCAFLKSARREAMEVIKDVLLWKKKFSGKLIIAGCLVQYYGDKAPEIFPEADILLGVGEYGKLPGLLKQLFSGAEPHRLCGQTSPRFPFQRAFPRRISTPAHYAYLRISDGCDNRCAYCLIPELRGDYQERTRAGLISEARKLVEEGAREIILIAQDTSYYGYKNGGGRGLSSLLESLNDIQGLDWIRIMYTHPGHIDRLLLQTIAACDKVCPYLDIPLQHINDMILAKMGRNINRAGIEEVIRQARTLIKGISIRTTFMVGFPGEGEEEFAELVDFVIAQRFEHLGVFQYSPEEGTPAFRYQPGVAEIYGNRRREKLMEIQQEISAERLKRLRGKVIPVIVDGEYPESGSPLMVGRGAFQAPEIDGIVVVEGEGITAGQLVEIKITDSSEYDLYGVKAGVPASEFS
jgi:ribosomal protein S12 methylthiotransferase